MTSVSISIYEYNISIYIYIHTDICSESELEHRVGGAKLELASHVARMYSYRNLKGNLT